MKRVSLFWLGSLWMTKVLNGQIVVDQSTPVQLNGRDIRAAMIPAGGSGTVAFTVDPSTAGGDVLDVDVSEPTAVVSIILPNSLEVTPDNASFLGWGYIRVSDGEFAGQLIPSIF